MARSSGTLLHWLLGILAMVPGCCCKKECVDSATNGVRLRGFTPEEMDTIVVVTTLAAPILVSPAETLSTAARWWGPDDARLYFPHLDDPQLRRSIGFPRIGRTYVLDGIKVDLKVCNACWVPGLTDHYKVVSSHRVDGEERNGVVTLHR